jgi:hypothetical protein
MNDFFSLFFTVMGVVIMVRNKSLSEKLGAFYARRYRASFGKVTHFLRLDDQNTWLDRFMYRGFIITAGPLLLIFAFAALTGTNFVGPASRPSL